MTYFRIVIGKEVVSVGTVFLKWNEKRHKFNVCPVDEGQFVQSYDENGVYRDAWLKPAPAEAISYQMAKVEIIDEEEYEATKSWLGEGEHVYEEEPVEQEDTQHTDQPEPQPEKIMSVAEMRHTDRDRKSVV